jgi:hypothetical protein
MAQLRVDSTAIMRDESASVVAIIRESPLPQAIGAIVEDTHIHSDWLTEGAKTLIPPGPIACAQGCFFCCHLRVVTTIPEVLWIAANFRSCYDAGALRSLLERVDVFVDAVVGRSVAERRSCRLPCPLLVDGLCSVYEVRPLSCRGWNSPEVSRCEADFHEPSRGTRAPVYEPQRQISACIQAGMSDGLQSAGLQYDRIELAEGLRVAIEVADAADCWLRGERLFVAAVF